MNGGGATPDLSALLGNLLSNPAAMSMLSSLLSGMGAATPKPTAEGGNTPDNALPAIAAGPPCTGQGCPHPTCPPPSCPQAGGRDERAALLYALRPFLPPDKCEMIDGLLRILDLLSVIRGRRA